MTSKYIEKFFVAGIMFGIEDYEDGQPMEEHFFGSRYKSGRVGDCKRFRLWINGCGFGQTDTLQEARESVVDRAKTKLSEELTELKTRQSVIQEALDQLHEPSHLFRFEANQ